MIVQRAGGARSFESWGGRVKKCRGGEKQTKLVVNLDILEINGNYLRVYGIFLSLGLRGYSTL